MAAFVALDLMPRATPYVLVLAASSFLYVAMADLIPGLHRGRTDAGSLRQIVLIAAGIATMAPLTAQAYDNIAPIGSVAAATTIIDGPAAVPYGGFYGPGFGDYRSERGYYGKTTRVHHGPFHDHAEVVVPRRLGRGGDGIAAAQRILTARRVPIIFCTAYSDAAVVQRMKAVDPVGIAGKPIERHVLSKLIDSAPA